MPRKPARLFLGIFLVFASVFFSSNSSVLAVSISIKNYPGEVVAGNEFSAEIEAKDIETNKIYFIKSYGGDNNSNVKTYNPDKNLWLGYSGSSGKWEDMPTFTIATGSSLLFSIKSKYNENQAGLKKYYLKFQSPDVSSEIVEINVIPPSPTPTITPTPTPNPTSILPTNTPEPTSTVKPISTSRPTATKIPSKTPTPKKTPAPTKKSTLTAKPASQSQGKVLGKEANTSVNSGNDLAKILTLIGVIFGVCSVAVFILSKYENQIKSFIERKFKK